MTHRVVTLTLAFLSLSLTVCCKTNNANGKAEFIPTAPDYNNPQMWYRNEASNDTGADVFYIVSTWETDWKTKDGRTCHYADVWNPRHRADMSIEQRKAAGYMKDAGRFFAPYYRHTTIETWATLNEDTIHQRTRMPMDDVKKAFDHYLAHENNGRPIIIAGFSQGGMAVVELLKHISDETMKRVVAAYVLGYKVTPQDTIECKRIRAAQDSTDTGVTICYNTVKDVRFIQPVVSTPCALCINPVNWRTDATPATLHDSITIRVSPEHHVLVVNGYSGSEYKPILGFLNVGDIHSCEPWLYSNNLRRNMRLRVTKWMEAHQKAQPYIGLDQMPRLIDIMPAPPAFDSPEFAYDVVRFGWGKQQRQDTNRVAQAIADAEWNNHAKLYLQWKDAFGLEINATETPEIWTLLERSLATTDPMRKEIKAHYARQRPFERFNDAMPSHEENNLRGEGSYPSGHSLRGWTISLLLAQIAPQRANEIFVRGWDYCNSRVIVGAHWQSDVDNSRTAASIGFCALQDNHDFIAQMKKAQQEYKEKTTHLSHPTK